jgi:hypothetical protein
VKTEEIAGDDADEDLDQSDGDADPNGDDACYEGESHPRRGDEPNVRRHLRSSESGATKKLLLRPQPVEQESSAGYAAHGGSGI